MGLLPPPQLASVRPRVVQCLVSLGLMLCSESVLGLRAMVADIVEAISGLHYLKACWLACAAKRGSGSGAARKRGSASASDSLDGVTPEDRALLGAARVTVFGSLLSLARAVHTSSASSFPASAFDDNQDIALPTMEHIDGAHVSLLQVARELFTERAQFLSVHAADRLWVHLCTLIQDDMVSMARR